MKKIYYFVCLLFVMTACEQTDEFTQETDPKTNSEERIRFFGVKKPDSALRGSAQQDRLWHTGTTIKVKFLHDPYGKADVIKEYAKEWEEYANISFLFVEEEEAHIRVGFDWNSDRYITWSYIGTDCKYETDQTQATMSLADIRYISDEELRTEVLRTFGMALGLELEFRHSDMEGGSGLWDEDYIREYWSDRRGEITDIPWESLKKYVFEPLEEINRIETAEYDPQSIMVWPFPRRYLPFDDYHENDELSAKDIQFIKELYPKQFRLLNATILEFSEPVTLPLITGSYSWDNVTDISEQVRIAVDGKIIYEGNYSSIPESVEGKIIEIEAEYMHLNHKSSNTEAYSKIKKIYLTDKTEYKGVDLRNTPLEEVILNGIPYFGTLTSPIFSDCKELKYIPEGLFDRSTAQTSIAQTFSGCEKITSIPENLFKNCVNLETFFATFARTGITSIPENLFVNCPKARYFDSVFSGNKNLTSIPENLFWPTDLQGLYYSFSNTGITTLPEGLFDGCPNLQLLSGAFADSEIISIPENLFHSNPELSSTEGTFAGTKITSVPEELFINSNQLYSINSAFSNTNITSIPENLLMNCPELKTIRGTFSNTPIASIPENLFNNCPKIEDISYAFSNSAITSIPTSLFPYSRQIRRADGVFSECLNLEHIPEYFFNYDRFNYCTHSKTFYGCVNADNYNSIPADWK